MMDSTIKTKSYIKTILIIGFWIMVWQIGYIIVGRDLYLPAPFQVFSRLTELGAEKAFWTSIMYSVYRVGLGVILSVILGIAVGIISGMNDLVYEILNPAMVAIKSTPVMSFIILALIWFSSTNSPIFICFLMCFPLVWTNTVAGIRNVDKKLLEMAHIYDVSKKQIIKKIYLPSLKPYFVSSSVQALGLGWKVTVAAEVLSNPRHSIGGNLYAAKAYLDIPGLFAWTITVIGLSYVFEVFFVSLMKKKMGSERL